MAYSTATNVESRMNIDVIEDLISFTRGTADYDNILATVIADSDAEVDLWGTSGWTTAQKKAASVSLSIEKLYQLDRNNLIPKAVLAEADTWRSLMKAVEVSYLIPSYDPMQDETQDELDSITLGPDLDRNL